ncbi:MAG: membrane dipeptidase [Deltaproteobacteria bacterium]|nr:membrane dipeptidase [Deltaproteobacteria bacterium]
MSREAPERPITEGAALSRRARELCEVAELIDLHLDTLIWQRIFGYDPLLRHEGYLGGRLLGHADLPRLLEGGVKGAHWSITTNPLRRQTGRSQALLRNLRGLRDLVERSEGALQIAGSLGAYREARAAGAHVVLPAIQGGNALAPAPRSAALPDPDLIRVTLVHLTSSWIGSTSSPLRLRPGAGLSEAGKELVRRLDAHRVLVDLAHIHPRGFWDAVDVHDPSLPLICTHTGVSGVTPHWRNLDDRQLEAIAATGGVIGVIFQETFLESPGGAQDANMVVDHLDHIISVCGEDHAAIGTDHDGLVTPPRGLRSASGWPRLVETMLVRGYSEARIRKILGENFLRVFGAIRP